MFWFILFLKIEVPFSDNNVFYQLHKDFLLTIWIVSYVYLASQQLNAEEKNYILVLSTLHMLICHPNNL